MKQKKQGKGLQIAILAVGFLILAILVVIVLQGGVFVIEGLNGADGKNGTDGKDGVNGQNGSDGKTAYELALEDGFEGTLHEWLLSLAVRGSQGAEGVGIRDVRVNSEGHLILTLSNGRELDAGVISTGSADGELSDTPDADGFYETYETVIMNELAADLNLRAKPEISNDSTILYTISSGAELLRVGDQRTPEGFSRLVYEGEICYARSKYFDLKYEYEGEIPAINLPARFVLTVDRQFWFYTDQIVPDLPAEMTVSYLWSGSAERTYNGEAAFGVTPHWKNSSTAATHAPESAKLTVQVKKTVEGELCVIAERTCEVVVVAEQKDLQLSGIIIGDSRISDNTTLTDLVDQLPNLTLMGTRQTLNSGIMHEGRSSWSTDDFLNQPYKDVTATQRVQNAFYNPTTQKFDFAYYMQKLKSEHGGSDPDFVILNLGANDNFSLQSVENLKAMVDSIRAYASANNLTIEILVMTEYRSPATDYYLTQSYNTDVAAKRAKQAAYFAYLEAAFGDREDEHVHLLPVHVGINDWSDWTRATVSTDRGDAERITDVVHLGRQGYLKEAALIRSYLYWLFGVAA